LHLKVPESTAALLLGAALLLASPLFVVFGAWSDRVGRKPLILAGCVLAAASWMPLFDALASAANPALVQAQQRVAVRLLAEPGDCSWHLTAINAAPTRDCETAMRLLSDRAVRYARVDASGAAMIAIGGESISITGNDEGGLLQQRVEHALDAAGYPRQADPARIDHVRVIAILFLLVMFVAMVYGPIAAMLVEMFPTRVRCSSVSLPYHLGNGWFGGLLPSAVLAISAHSGQFAAGLWLPIVVALGSAVIGLVWLRDTKGTAL
jgi:MFS family permease